VAERDDSDLPEGSLNTWSSCATSAAERIPRGAWPQGTRLVRAALSTSVWIARSLRTLGGFAGRGTAAVLLGALLLSCSDSPASTASPSLVSATPASASEVPTPRPSVSGAVTFEALQDVVVAAGFPGCQGSSTRSNYGADLLRCATSGKHSLLFLEAADRSEPLQNSLVAFVYGCKQRAAGYRPGPYWVITDRSSFIVFSSSKRVATRLAAVLEPLGGRPGTIC
jgi:hypothetical protein